MNDERALEAPLHFCKQAGCPRKTRDGWCPDHKLNNDVREADRLRQTDDINRLYKTKRWLRFRKMMLRQNAQCQRLYAAAQCKNPATLVHHLTSPRQLLSGMFDQHTCIALCAGCHPPIEGTPRWRPNIEYIPTRWEIRGTV